MEPALKKSARKPPPPGPGRPKGLPNKTTRLLKDAILRAAELAGEEQKPDGEHGLVSYLQWLAKEEAPSFATLMGKVLPTQVSGDPDNPMFHVTRIELVAPDSKD